MKRNVLFIGRFQPFHKGHLGTIQKIVETGEVKLLVIGIGSSDDSHTAYNPFTASEREEMIRVSLDINIPFEIKYIPDHPDNDVWTKSLLEKYFDGELVYSGNELVQQLLTAAGKEVRIPPPIKNPSGTEIRQMMVEDKDWMGFVSEETQKVIKKIAGDKRVKKIFSE